MIKVYTSASCPSCRKAKSWLNEHRLEFIEINLFQTKLTVGEVQEIFRLTENGIDEVISRRSKVFDELGINIEELSLQELFRIICKCPVLLKRPILIDNKRLQVGYHEEEIRRFLPRSIRKRSKGGDIYVSNSRRDKIKRPNELKSRSDSHEPHEIGKMY